MKIKQYLSILLLLALVLLSGCIDYEEEITLNKNGSGVMKIHYYIDESMMAMMQEYGGPFSFEKEK